MPSNCSSTICSKQRDFGTSYGEAREPTVAAILKLHGQRPTLSEACCGPNGMSSASGTSGRAGYPVAFAPDKSMAINAAKLSRFPPSYRIRTQIGPPGRVTVSASASARCERPPAFRVRGRCEGAVRSIRPSASSCQCEPRGSCDERARARSRGRPTRRSRHTPWRLGRAGGLRWQRSCPQRRRRRAPTMARLSLAIRTGFLSK